MKTAGNKQRRIRVLARDLMQEEDRFLPANTQRTNNERRNEQGGNEQRNNERGDEQRNIGRIIKKGFRFVNRLPSPPSVHYR